VRCRPVRLGLPASSLAAKSLLDPHLPRPHPTVGLHLSHGRNAIADRERHFALAISDMHEYAVHNLGQEFQGLIALQSMANYCTRKRVGDSSGARCAGSSGARANPGPRTHQLVGAFSLQMIRSNQAPQHHISADGGSQLLPQEAAACLTAAPSIFVQFTRRIRPVLARALRLLSSAAQATAKHWPPGLRTIA
jgi:hypothetical protein